jgi:nitrate/TMAO reductase-like tetraheme cytochrome c subunit
VLKRFNTITTAVIIGFISGSLGVVWPWKKTIYKTNALEKIILDSNNNKVVLNYQRYIPNFETSDTWWAIFWMGIGLLFLIILERYGNREKK